MTKKETYKKALMDIGFKVSELDPKGNLMEYENIAINLNMIHSLPSLLRHIWREARYHKTLEIQKVLGMYK